jgi:hypothetical protein
MNYLFLISQFILILILSFILIVLFNTNFIHCPNKDMLLWDANIRMIQSIDFLKYLEYRDSVSAIKLIFDSPTWPPLRTLMSTILILINGKPDPILDTRLSIFFFILTITVIFWGTIYYFFEEYKKNLLNKIIIFLSIYLTITFLFLLDQIPEYLFNSMLEIQGMFLYTAFIFLIYYFFINHKYSKIDKILFFLLGFLIYFTKYPYGVLISITFVILEFLYQPKEFIKSIYKLITFYKNYRIIFIILPLIGIIFILIFPHIPNNFFKLKSVKNFIYLVILISFFELNFFLYRKKIQLFSPIFNFYYKFFIFPFSMVILSHPDRFHSLLGAQSDTIDKSRSFFISIVYDYFLNSIGFSFLLLISLIGIMYYFFKHSRNRLKELIQNYPIIYVILFLWIHFFILEFLTTNHQARYIFQIIPGLILFHSLFFLYIKENVKYAVIIILFIILMMNLYYLEKNPPSKRNTCFAGYDKLLFEPARIISQTIPSNFKGIIFNEFHEYKKYNENLNNPYLFIPTDIDVHIRYKTYSNGFVLNYSKYQKIPEDFKNAIYITNSCKNELKNSRYFNLNIINYKKIIEKQIDDNICFKIYELEK